LKRRNGRSVRCLRVLIVDTSAWIAFFRESVRGEKVKERLIGADRNITHTLVLVELQKHYAKSGVSREDFEKDVNRIKTLCRIDSEIPEAIASEVGRVLAEPKAKGMSLVDCTLLVLARHEPGGKVLSCDGDFKKWKETLVIGGSK
jgi:predicted nucleic acid-binding protein